MSADSADVAKPATVPVAYPSIGALVGSVLGGFIASRLGLSPADPAGASLTGAIAGIVSGLFNQVGKWLHIS